MVLVESTFQTDDDEIKINYSGNAMVDGYYRLKLLRLALTAITGELIRAEKLEAREDTCIDNKH